MNHADDHRPQQSDRPPEGEPRSHRPEDGGDRQQQEDDKILAAEATRRAEEEAIARERATVSDTIGYGLSRLAAKDLTCRIDNMPEAYRKLQADFNVALEALEPPARKQRAAASGAATTDGWEEF